MKTKYLKGITALGFAAVLFFSSCLKDSRYFNPESVQSNLAELPLSGLAHFSADAIVSTGLDTITFAVGVTAANPPATSTAVTLAVDNTIITSYNAANPAITYVPIPASAFKLNANVTVPAGKNSALTTVIIDLTQLDPSKSYLLPVKIASASGLPISANYGIHYYHIIGNDFAGTYRQTFRRWNASDSTTVAANPASFAGQPVSFIPLSPTEFTVKSGYAGSLVSYDVTFTKNADGTYTNFAVQILPSDVGVLTANGITLVQQPKWLPATPSGNYTFAQTLTLFHFQWIAATSSNRYLVDQYYK